LDREALDLVNQTQGLCLPRSLGLLPRWDDLVYKEKERILSAHGEAAFEDQRVTDGYLLPSGPLLKKRYAPGSSTPVVELTKKAEAALLSRQGPKGFRRLFKDEDGVSREYLAKHFRTGSASVEIRLSWYGQAWPLVDEARDRERAILEGLKRRHTGLLFEELTETERNAIDSRLRFMESIRDAREVMSAILLAFGRDGENPLRMPAWCLRTLLECESDPAGFRRIEGCLRALQEVRFHAQVTGDGKSGLRAFGPFLGEVSYVALGRGAHTDGDFYLQIAPAFIGCLRVFAASNARVRDARQVLTYDWSRVLDKEEKENIRPGFTHFFSSLAPYHDQAAGFSPPQSRLRQWIESQITLRKDPAAKGRKGGRARWTAPDANRPRLYDRAFCPLLPEGRAFFGALGHFKQNPETGRKLTGTPRSQSGKCAEGLLCVMGYHLPQKTSRAGRRDVVRQAVRDMQVVIGESLGGVVAARHQGQWLSFETAMLLPDEELLKHALWLFFLPEDWQERLSLKLENYHTERHARGETPYLVKVTTERGVAQRGERERAGERFTGSLIGEPLRLRLYAKRKQRQLSQVAVGAIFEVSQRTVDYWEKGIEPDEQGKVRGRPIPTEMVPFIQRWIETGAAPSKDELALRRTTRRRTKKATSRVVLEPLGVENTPS
jgi:hypothetical protein